MPRHGSNIHFVLPPLDHRLKGTSAWINELSGVDHAPKGWPT
jgi:hypothetical protein